MESNTSPRDRNDFSAADALQQLASDRAAFSERIATPRWYYPVLSIAAALIVLVPAMLDAGGW